VNTIHGNLEFLQDADARWFARVQRIYEEMQAKGRTKTFGGIPGDVQPYGFGSLDADGAIYTVVNPAQSFAEITLPLLTRIQGPLRDGRLIFRDAGYIPVVHGNRIQLGPGQLAAVGFGRYAKPAYELGIQEDVIIPRSIAPIPATFEARPANTIEAIVTAPQEGDVRIIFQQRDSEGAIMRSWPGGPPNGTPVGKVLKIYAEQEGKEVPVEVSYDKKIWSGLSWGAGEIKHASLVPGKPLLIRCSSAEKDKVILEGRLYAVKY
jgi:hypothetical protein